MKKFFHFPSFIIALALGILFVYLTEPPNKVVYIYPSPENINKFEYKDKADNCFNYTMDRVDCPKDKSLISSIPIQD